ncbi:MAG TPA: TOMM precursor leader peptide-binding protein, partial [Propionicimonas sp.]
DLHFPERPVFVEDLACFEMPDGLGFQFRGGEAPVLVRGRLVKPVLEYLQGALDGTRGVLDVVRGRPEGLPASAVAQTLLVLHSKGVIAAPDPGPVSPARERRELMFWGRHLAITRSSGSASEVLARAEHARIVLLGDGLFLAVVVDLLTRSGFTNLAGLQVESSEHKGSAGQDDHRLAILRREIVGADLLVTATVDASRAFLLAINDTIIRSRTPWLVANWDGSTVDIGPLVQPGETACYECVLLRRASTDPLAIENALYQDNLAGKGRTLAGEALWPTTLAASTLVAEVSRCVTGIAPPTLTDAVLTMQPVSGVMIRGEVQRVPRCPGCYSGAIPPQDLSEPVDVL